MAPHARVSVVIVSYNTRADLERCLRSLGDTPAAIAVDVVVVDNASGDGSSDWVRANCPAVRLIDAGVVRPARAPPPRRKGSPPSKGRQKPRQSGRKSKRRKN